MIDGKIEAGLSDATRTTLLLFPKMLEQQESILRGYHRENPAHLFLHADNPLDALKKNTRLIATLYLTKTIYYSRSIIEGVNANNLLVAFQSMRALIEAVAAVRYTLEQMAPIVHECALRGVVTSEQAAKLNHSCNLLLHGGRFDWPEFFQAGVQATIDKKNRPRTKVERQEFEQQKRYLKVDVCMKDWAKKQPLAQFAYDYLCDLVHPNKGSNLVLIVETESGPVFNVGGPTKLGFIIFDRIFPLVARLCSDEFTTLFLAFGVMGADEDRLESVSRGQS